MMVCCPVHGESLSILVSPDIFASMPGGFLPPHKRYSYVYDDAEVMWFVLSDSYVAQNEIGVETVSQLPDDYPPWMTGLHPACIPCLRAIDASLPAE